MAYFGAADLVIELERARVQAQLVEIVVGRTVVGQALNERIDSEIHHHRSY